MSSTSSATAHLSTAHLSPVTGLRRLARTATAVLVLMVAAVTWAAPGASAGTGLAPSPEESTITQSLQQERAERGLPALTVRTALVAVARAQARRMAASNTLYHNPNLTRDVPNWRWVGENVGYGPDALTVHVAFMQSPGHKANILDTDYTEVGIGAVTVDGRVWVAEVFRQPLRVTSRTHRAAAQFQHTLRHGSTGPAVKRVQSRLHLRATGYYGASTRRAVRDFQQAQGWAGSGTVGRHTWRRMF